MKILAVILAGGEARRMGGVDKAMMALAGKPLIAHLIERFGPQAEGLAISANGDLARFSRFGLPVFADDQSKGPLSGILAGLLYAKAQGYDAVVSVPVDTPFVPFDLVARLREVPLGYAQAGRSHYATAIWPVSLADDLADFLASGAKPRIFDFAASHDAKAVEFDRPEAFDNLNSIGDLAAAEARLSALESGSAA